MSTATQKCEWFRFTDPHNYSGEKCDAAATTSIWGEGESARVCAAHEAQWKEHVAKWNAQRNEFRHQDRNARYVGWGLAALSVGLLFYFTGPIVGFLALIAAGVLYIALNLGRR
jgi:hypothetical protein